MSQKNYRDNSIMAPHKCGHTEKVYYSGGEQAKIKRLSEAERQLCSKCKERKLKKENAHKDIPYSYYITHLKKARNVIAGKYKPDTKEIEVWMPWSKYDEYLAISQRIYYEIHNTPVKYNRSILTIIMKGERTKEIKEKLKEMGAKWKRINNKQSCWVFENIMAYLEIDKNHNFFLPPEMNQQYYSIKAELDKLECIPDYSNISW